MFPTPHSARNPLFIPELLGFILGFLAEPSRSEPPYNPFRRNFQVQAPEPDGQRALAVLAQTCRTLSQPSLHQLWRKLKSLRPLLRCCYTVHDIDTGTEVLCPPSAADFIVMNRYTHRIQELEVHPEDVASRFLLECSIFESNLLPNLRVLRYQQSVDYIQPLLSPRLLVLDLEGSQSVSVTSFLKVCPLLCPSLRSVRFEIVTPSLRYAQLYGCFPQFLRGCDNLENLVIDGYVPQALLRHLFLSPKFKDLSLRIWISELENLVEPSDTPFCNVQKLNLTVLRLRHVGELLRSTNQPFRQVTFHFYTSATRACSLLSLFTKLASPLRMSSLQSIRLKSDRHLEERDTPESYVLSYDTFRPLSSFGHLRELSINIANSISLDDEELANLAQNWPLLEVFELCRIDTDKLSPANKRPTFHGLLSLAALCPKLRQVQLTLGGTEIPSGIPAHPASKSVTTMRFPGSPITDPYLVARFLLTYFPSVTSASERGVLVLQPYILQWIEVDKYLEAEREREGLETLKALA